MNHATMPLEEIERLLKKPWKKPAITTWDKATWLVLTGTEKPEEPPF